MKLKKSVLFLLAAFSTAAIMFNSSCKKNDDVSSAPAGSTDQMSALVSNNTNSNSNSSFSFTADDGHVIGINGNSSVAAPKGNSVQGCGSVTDLKVVAQQTGSYAVLTNYWSTGVGYANAIYLNGKQYVNCSTGYGLWLTSDYGITAYCNCMSGGIQPGQTFNVRVRTFCNTDTTGAVLGVDCFDSPVVTYTVPSSFVPTCGTSTPAPTPKKSGGGKRH